MLQVGGGGGGSEREADKPGGSWEEERKEVVLAGAHLSVGPCLCSRGAGEKERE